MPRLSGCTLLIILAPLAAGAQEGPPAIQDNSFLIEEAYNQEVGVVQHIGTFEHAGDDAWAFSFTQEWPLFSQRHQLSFTLPVTHVEAAGLEATGLGDVMVNYRYQLVGDGSAQLAMSPRVSLLFATGDEDEGLGGGQEGVELALPTSYVLSPRLVTHANAVVTFRADGFGDVAGEASFTDYTLGQSLVWLAHPQLNLMLEALWSSEEQPLAGREESFFLSPGVRGALNLRGGVQVVPGIAVPIGIGASSGERSLFLYLSVEHAFQ